MDNITEAIVATMAYHDIFVFPLTPFEVHKYLIGQRTKQTKTEHALAKTNHVVRTNNTHHLATRIVPSMSTYSEKTKRDKAWSLIAYAQKKLVPIASRLASIECIAVTGSIGALNESPTSDIDILIVCKPKTAWLTRLILITFLQITNQRSYASARDNYKKFCPNLFLETTDLAFISHNIFTAMEFAHMKIIYNNKNTFQKLLAANTWIQKFLPNFWEDENCSWVSNNSNVPPSHNEKVAFATRIIHVMDNLARFLQQKYYSLRHTNELTLNQTWITNYQERILKQFYERCKLYGINKD